MKPDSTNDTEYARLLRQRDQAFACAVLAVAMTGAILWSNFGPEPPELAETFQAVHRHRVSLSDHRKILEAVHSAIVANQQEVERLGKAR